MEFGASHTLLDAGKPDDAARALMAYIGTFGRNDMPPGAMDYGYEIYQKLGQQKSAQYFTSNMMGYYQMKDGQAENRAILQRGDEIQARYEKRIEEIRQRQQDLQQQMQTAQRARNTAQMRSLQQQQQQLNQELSQAIRDMNLEQMRNIDPNQGSGR
jgi:restriction endonuclease Mrr